MHNATKLAASLLLYPLLALADDLSALDIADAAPEVATTAKTWQLAANLTLGKDGQRQGWLQLRADAPLAPGWRFLLANRLDARWQDHQEQHTNSLQEAYLSWQPQPDSALDVGRINPRSGVALGFNPTDVFRDAGLRATVSNAPGSARENRLGVVMLRGQKLWDGGSASALFAPRLASAANPAPWSPDWGSSNRRDRWQLQLSQRLAEGIAPQWLLSGGAGEATQLGMNLSLLANDATTVYAEISTARQRGLADTAEQNKRRWRTLAALGGGYTTASKLTANVEYHYNGLALDDNHWRQLRGADYGRYRQLASAQQLSPTRREVFIFLRQEDFLRSKLELNLLLRHDLADRSRFTRLALRQQGDHAALTLSRERGSGQPYSRFGGQPAHWQLSIDGYF